MSPRRQFGLSITFVDNDDDDAVMRVPGIVEKEPSPTVAVVTPPSDERWAGFGSAAEKAQAEKAQVIVEADALLPKELLVRVLALLDAKEVAAVPRDERAARVLYERVADEP